MTLDKHSIDGLASFTRKTMPSGEFEALMDGAGYMLSGSAPAKGNRHKAWWSHKTYRRVEVIYSPDKLTVITAYHVDS